MRLCITDHGAAVGAENNAPVIQQCIDNCHQNGGGTVVVPVGTYICGAIQMRSHVELHLQHGATLKVHLDPALYPSIGSDKRQALLYADQAQYIAVTGTGTLDGDGDSKRWEPDVDPNEFRMSLIRFQNCSDIIIENIHLHWTRMWTLHLLRCSDVRISGCDIKARLDRINADGIDPDDCQRVRIHDCRISTGDDAIVLKSTSGGTCEDIVVSHCILESSCAAIKIGTESHGTIRRVLVNNCVVKQSSVVLGCYLKDGGTYEQIRFSDCLMEGTGDYPILIDHSPRFYNESPIGVLRDISIINCSVSSPGRMVISGHPEAPVTGLLIEGLTWQVTGLCPYGEGVEPPRGAARTRVDPQRFKLGQTPHHVVLDHCQHSTIQMHIQDRSAGTGDRGSSWQRSCTELAVSIRNDCVLPNGSVEHEHH